MLLTVAGSCAHASRPLAITPLAITLKPGSGQEQRASWYSGALPVCSSDTTKPATHGQRLHPTATDCSVRRPRRPGAVSLSPPHARGPSMRTTGPLPAFSTAAAIGSLVRGSTRRTVASSLLAPPHAPAHVSRMTLPPPIRLIASTFTFDAGTNASSSRVRTAASAGGCERSCWLAGGRQQARAGYSVYSQGALHQSWRTAAGPRAAARQRTDGRGPQKRGPRPVVRAAAYRQGLASDRCR
jgi:hypothetical protein